MKNLKYSFCLFILLGLMSCGGDRFSAVKTIEFPEHTPVLAVTTHLGAPSSNPNDVSIPSAFVSHSKGILDNEPFESIEDATVKLMKDGSVVYEFEFQDTDGNYYYNGPTVEITSGTYTLEVDAPNYEPIKATQTLPSKPEVISASYDFESVPYDFYSDLYDLFKVKLQDNPDEENYYTFDVTYEIRKTNTNEILYRKPYIESDDPLFEGNDYSGTLGLILPDISFNGNSNDIRLLLQSRNYVYDSNEVLQAVIIDVKSITRDYYLYERSLDLTSDAEDNPFAEPVLIHTNIEGGLGIFSLENSTRFRLEL